MKVAKGRFYLDSLGRVFECWGIGDRTGFPHGEAYFETTGRRRKRATAYDPTSGDVLGMTGAQLVCPYPANDWSPQQWAEGIWATGPSGGGGAA